MSDEEVKTEEDMTDEEKVALYLAAGIADEYRLTKLAFVPDVIYDIGADVGSITMFAHAAHPEAKIVAVEPNPWSYPKLAENARGIPEIIPVHAALGQGQMYEPTNCGGPLHWLVVGRDAPSWCDGFVPCDVPAVMLDELHATYGGEQYVVKMDCESAEHAALIHEPSFQMIANSAFFAAELHVWARSGNDVNGVADTIWRFLFRLAQTHTIYTKCYGACIHVWADRRIEGSVTGGSGIDEN